MMGRNKLSKVVYCLHDKQGNRVTSGRRSTFSYYENARTAQRMDNKVVPYVPLDSVHREYNKTLQGFGILLESLLKERPETREKALRIIVSELKTPMEYKEVAECFNVKID